MLADILVLMDYIITHTVPKTCLECGERISGRSDKKFCDDACRVAHHNKLYGDDNNLVRGVNHLLKRNRRILSRLNPKGTCRVTRQRMSEEGFNFQFLTHEAILRGCTFRFCYEYGYTPLDDDTYWIVIDKACLGVRNKTGG